MPFAEKVYTITGGARGIGLAVARYLAERRATVCIADILHEDLIKAEKQLQIEFPHVSIIRRELDVANGTEVEEWLDNIKVGLGRLDGCVNNAGIAGHWKPISQQTDDDWNNVIRINLKGVFNCLRSQLPRIEKGGSIVNVSSVAGLHGFPNAGVYCASKFGIIGLTKTAAHEVGAEGTRVNAVCPGLVDTPMVPGINTELGSMFKPENAKQIFKRMAKPEEIAHLIGYLLSDESRFTTGTAIPIDGGDTA